MTGRRPAMPWRDNPETYGWITRALHWGIAALILWQILGMVLRLALGRMPVVSLFVGLHQPLGATLFVLIAARLLWALAQRRRRPGHGRGPLARATRAGHVLLYALMVAVPALGLLRAWGNTRAFAPWGLPVFPARETEIAWATTLADRLHGELAWALTALILGHVVMALIHALHWCDGTLARMAGRR
ncbi:cytochrome b [Aquicoccus sp. SCR17]|nr:cytochrome b [Carideicomes alvinocaridis]